MGHVSVGWPYAGAEYIRSGEFVWEASWDAGKTARPEFDTSLPKKGVQFKPVIHLMREPLSHIGSLVGCLCPGNWFDTPGDIPSFDFAARVLDEALHNRSRTKAKWEGDREWRIQFAAAYWLEWNQLAARYATKMHHIEALDGPQLADDTGMAGGMKLPAFDVLSGAAPNGHDGLPNSDLSWGQLQDKVGKEFATQIRKAAEEWGYSYTEQGTLWKIAGTAVNSTDDQHHARWAFLSSALRPPGFASAERRVELR